MLYFQRFLVTPLALAAVAVALTACGGGGGDDDNAAKPGVVAGCSIVGAWSAPSAAEVALYANTWQGHEGEYSNAGLTFTPNATTATVTLQKNGTVVYNNTTYTPSSICLDDFAGTSHGRTLQVITKKNYFIFSQEDGAWTNWLQTADTQFQSD
jgi:hypothetical protein